MRTTVLELALCLSTVAFAQPTLIEQGRAAFIRSDFETAANLLEKAVAQSPNSAEAHYLLGAAYGRLTQQASIFSKAGLARKAKVELEHAVQLDPDDLDARLALIEYYLAAPAFLGGGERKAIEQANEIKKRDAFMGHRAFASLYDEQKKPDLARKEYIDAVKEQPTSPKTHYWLGVSFLGDDNYKSAAEEFETSVKLDPNFMPGWFQIGHAAVLSKANFQRGEEGLRRYLAYAPKFHEPPLHRAHFWLGRIYEEQGKKGEAKASYATSLKLNPHQKDVADALKRVSSSHRG